MKTLPRINKKMDRVKNFANILPTYIILILVIILEATCISGELAPASDVLSSVVTPHHKQQQQQQQQHQVAKVRTTRWTHFGDRLQPLEERNWSIQGQQQQQQQVNNLVELTPSQQQQLIASGGQHMSDEDVMLSLMRQAELEDLGGHDSQPRRPVYNNNNNNFNNNNNNNNNRASAASNQASLYAADRRSSSSASDQISQLALADLHFRNAHIHKVDDSDDQVRGQPMTNNRLRHNNQQHQRQRQRQRQRQSILNKHLWRQQQPATTSNIRSFSASSHATSFVEPKLQQQQQQQQAYMSQINSRRAINNTNDQYQCRSDGIYADAASGCQSYHVCQSNTHKTTFQCPLGTLFNNAILTCDFAHNVDCAKLTAQFDQINDNDNSLGDTQQNDGDQSISSNSNSNANSDYDSRATIRTSSHTSAATTTTTTTTTDTSDDDNDEQLMRTLAPRDNYLRIVDTATTTATATTNSKQTPNDDNRMMNQKQMFGTDNLPTQLTYQQQKHPNPQNNQDSTSHSFTQVINHIAAPQSNSIDLARPLVLNKPLKAVTIKKKVNNIVSIPTTNNNIIDKARSTTNRIQEVSGNNNIQRQSNPVAIDLTHGQGSSLSADHLNEHGSIILVRHPDGGSSSMSRNNANQHLRHKSLGQAYAVEASAVRPVNSLDSVVFPHVQNMILTTTSNNNQHQLIASKQHNQSQSQSHKQQQLQAKSSIKVRPIPPPMAPPLPQITTTSSSNILEPAIGTTIQIVGRPSINNHHDTPTVASQRLRQQVLQPPTITTTQSSSNARWQPHQTTPSYNGITSSTTTISSSTKLPAYQLSQQANYRDNSQVVSTQSNQLAPTEDEMSFVEHSITIDHNLPLATRNGAEQNSNTNNTYKQNNKNKLINNNSNGNINQASLPNMILVSGNDLHVIAPNKQQQSIDKKSNENYNTRTQNMAKIVPVGEIDWASQDEHTFDISRLNSR